MSKINRNSIQSSKYNNQVEDDYEDYGYEVKNARRYKSQSKRTPKFKDYSDEYDSFWTVH